MGAIFPVMVEGVNCFVRLRWGKFFSSIKDARVNGTIVDHLIPMGMAWPVSLTGEGSDLSRERFPRASRAEEQRL